MAKFEYKARTAEAIDKRATQQGGDFQGFILDEFRTYTPKKGDNWIRFLPPTFEGAQHYGMDVWVHYGIGPDRASVICPAKQPHPIEGTFGKCPMCEARMRAERAGNDELAGELKASKRVLVWLLDRREESNGPLLWAMPWTLDRDICKISRDKRSGEVFLVDHPYEGYDVNFDRDGEGMQVKYNGISIARRQSSVDEEHLEFVQGAPLPFTLRWREYDELLELYEGSGMEDAGRRGSGDRGGDRAPRQDDRRGSDSRESRQDDRRDAPRDPPARAQLQRDPPSREPPARAALRQPTETERAIDDRIPENGGTNPQAPYRDDPPPREERQAAAPSGGGTSAADRAAALRARFATK